MHSEALDCCPGVAVVRVAADEPRFPVCFSFLFHGLVPSDTNQNLLVLTQDLVFPCAESFFVFFFLLLLLLRFACQPIGQPSFGEEWIAFCPTDWLSFARKKERKNRGARCKV